MTVRRNWLPEGTGLLLALAGAVLWAIDLTKLQPLTEPDKPWHDVSAENNTYWARDLRFAAIVVVVAGFVLSVRGDRLLSWCATGAGLAWFGVDVVLDRADVAGSSTAFWVSLAAAAVVLGGRFAATRRVLRPGRGMLAAGSSVAAAMVSASMFIETPSEDDHGLTILGIGLAAAFVAICLGSALAAAPRVDATTVWFTAGAAAVAMAGPVMTRLGWSEFDHVSPLSYLPSVCLLVASVIVAGDFSAPTPQSYTSVIVVAGIIVGYPFLLFFVMVVTTYLLPVANPLTSLAGNPPVNAGDADSLMTLSGLLVGLFFGWRRQEAVARAAIAADRPRPIASVRQSAAGS
jgi:HAMP domain-containing protein